VIEINLSASTFLEKQILKIISNQFVFHCPQMSNNGTERKSPH